MEKVCNILVSFVSSFSEKALYTFENMLPAQIG